jgi:two-component system response regulator
MRRSRTILLVEDNPADVAITRRGLREIGFEADLVVVRDGEEALDYLLRRGRHADDAQWRPPDLVLLDVNLPRLNGRQVLGRIRASAELGPVPVVALTTSAREEDVREMYAAGANTYIAKPADFAQFVRVLQTILHYWLDTALLPPPP